MCALKVTTMPSASRRPYRARIGACSFQRLKPMALASVIGTLLILTKVATGQVLVAEGSPTPSPTSTPTPRSAFKIEGCVPHATNTGCGFEFGFVYLSPLGRTAEVFGGHFVFEDVPPGTYTLRYSERCNPFGCRLPVTATVVEKDVFVLFRLLYPVRCAGDCGRDGRVSVDEVVECVNMAMDGTHACTPCDPGLDGSVTVDEVIQAIYAALAGCPP